MTQIFNILLITLMAFLNRTRGGGRPPIGKLPSYLLMGISAALYSFVLGYSVVQLSVIGCIVAIGMWAWGQSGGWGSYFYAFKHTVDKGAYQEEVKWIDVIINKLFGHPDFNTTKRILKGTVGMCLRGLHMYPMFVALSIYLESYLISIIGLVAVTQGIVYVTVGYIPFLAKNNIANSEIIWGAVVGGLLILSLS